jgi:hypothetical protein
VEKMRKTAPMEPVWSTIGVGQEAKKEILAELSTPNQGNKGPGMAPVFTCSEKTALSH